MKDPVTKNSGAWAQSSNLTDFERDLLDAATRDRMPEPLKLRMSDAFQAHLAGLPDALPAALSDATTTSFGAGGSIWFSKVAAIGVASALLVGGAVAFQVLRANQPASPHAATPSAAAPFASPVPRATLQPPAAASSRLRDEIFAMDAARTALKASQPTRALELLANYERSFPAGALVPEAAALRIEALVQSGAAERAKELARRFLATYPSSPLAHRVERLTPAAK